MVIEWLKIKVSPELREKFIQKDEEIWTTALSKSPGFLGKQVWINPSQADEVILVIHWANREAWKSVPADLLKETERLFSQAIGEGTAQIIETEEYQVRKFPRPN
ncbi:MAG: TIGR03792 family protein [Kovacikia sp.]